MVESWNSDELKYSHPESEVVYLYQGEEEDRPMYNGKYIVELDKPRPNWWPKNLLTKAVGNR